MSGNIEKMSMSRVLAMDSAWTLGERAQSVDLCMLKEDSDFEEPGTGCRFQETGPSPYVRLGLLLPYVSLSL